MDVKIRVGHLRRLVREACKKPRYWGHGGAGVLFLCSEDDTVLLLKRAGWVAEGGTWGIPGGAVDEGWQDTPITEPIQDEEEFVEAAIRETAEECGSLPPGFSLSRSTPHAVWEDCGFRYFTYLVRLTARQRAAWLPESHDQETDDFQWFPLTDLPSDLHPGVEWALQRLPV